MSWKREAQFPGKILTKPHNYERRRGGAAAIWKRRGIFSAVITTGGLLRAAVSGPGTLTSCLRGPELLRTTNSVRPQTNGASTETAGAEGAP